MLLLCRLVTGCSTHLRQYLARSFTLLAYYYWEAAPPLLRPSYDPLATLLRPYQPSYTHTALSTASSTSSSTLILSASQYSGNLPIARSYCTILGACYSLTIVSIKSWYMLRALGYCYCQSIQYRPSSSGQSRTRCTTVSSALLLYLYCRVATLRTPLSNRKACRPILPVLICMSSELSYLYSPWYRAIAFLQYSFSKAPSSLVQLQ